MMSSMNSPMEKPLLLETRDLDAQRLSSSPWWSARNCPASTKSLTNPSSSVTSMLGKICIPTLLWAVELLCSLASLKDSVRKSQLWPLQPWRLKCWLPQRESSLSGSVVLFCPPSRLSRLCGLPKPNIKRLDQASSTESASDCSISRNASLFIIS